MITGLPPNLQNNCLYASLPSHYTSKTANISKKMTFFSNTFHAPMCILLAREMGDHM